MKAPKKHDHLFHLFKLRARDIRQLKAESKPNLLPVLPISSQLNWSPAKESNRFALKSEKKFPLS